MGVKTYIYNFVHAYLLMIYYSCCVLLAFVLEYLKNPFVNPWAQKLKLVPPENLANPNYGVHKYLKANNIKYHYVESGDSKKPLMIFVHGYPEFWYSWRHQIIEFQKDYWCVAVDLRGFGDSERPEGVASYKIELIVEDLRDLVRQLGREKCILVGHDWGGIIGCRFREVYPDVLDAIIILASGSCETIFKMVFCNPIQKKMSWYVFLNLAPAIPERLMRVNDLQIIDKLMIKDKEKSTYVTAEDLECYKYWFRKEGALTPALNYYRANFLFDVVEKQRCERNVPFLAVNADDDPFLHISVQDSMKNEYAHIETVALHGCGHFLQQQDPATINKLVKDFLHKHNL